MAEEKKVAQKRTAKDTLLFLWHSLYKNVSLLEEEEKGWLAILIGLLSVVLSVSGILITGLNSNANSIASTASETAVEEGFSDFAADIAKSPNTDNISIINGELVSSGKFQPIDISVDTVTDGYSNAVHASNVTYTRINGSDTTPTNIFKVWVLSGIDPVNNSGDSAKLSAFINTSVYLYSVVTNSSSVTSTAATWTPCSFMILTPNSIHISAYKPVGATSTNSAVVSISGVLSSVADIDLYTVGHDTAGNVLTKTAITDNMLKIINSAYKTVMVKNTWSQTGIYAAMDFGVTLVAGLVFWLISRSKNSILHFSFWQSIKIVCFMALTPAIITFAISFWLTSYAPFVYMMIIALRIMSAVQKLSGGSSQEEQKPVYKARA
jgi:uncharacterized membrane protein